MVRSSGDNGQSMSFQPHYIMVPPAIPTSQPEMGNYMRRVTLPFGSYATLEPRPFIPMPIILDMLGPRYPVYAATSRSSSDSCADYVTNRGEGQRRQDGRDERVTKQWSTGSCCSNDEMAVGCDSDKFSDVTHSTATKRSNPIFLLSDQHRDQLDKQTATSGCVLSSSPSPSSASLHQSPFLVSNEATDSERLCGGDKNKYLPQMNTPT